MLTHNRYCDMPAGNHHMKPDPCPSHIAPKEWKAFLHLLEMHKGHAAGTVDMAYLAATAKRTAR